MRKESEFCTNVCSQHQDLLLKEINVRFGKCLSCLYHIVDSFTQKSLTLKIPDTLAVWETGFDIGNTQTMSSCEIEVSSSILGKMNLPFTFNDLFVNFTLWSFFSSGPSTIWAIKSCFAKCNEF